MTKTQLFQSIVVAGVLAGVGSVSAEDMVLPELVTQDGAQAVVDEHLDALNECDWDRLMAQYPDEVEFHLVDGVLVKGRRRSASCSPAFANRTRTAA